MLSGTAYKMVIRGEFDDRFACLFDGMDMQRVEGTTVLTGNADQAQLIGFVERLGELGVELVSLEQIKGGN